MSGWSLTDGDLPEVAEVEQALDVVDLNLVDVEPLDQACAQRGLHGRPDLEAHDLAEAAPAQLVLDRLEQVIGLVGDLEIGVARDAEQVVAEDLHPGEQRIEVAGDDVLERDERVLLDLHESRQDLLGHLDAGERLLVGIGVVEVDDQAQREVGDVGERPAGADAQRREDREDLLAEVSLDRLVGRARLGAADDADALLGQLGLDHSGELLGVATVELTDATVDPCQHLGGGEAVGAARVDPGIDLVVDAGDADHEELVEVGDEDRQELEPLDQRQRLVLGQLENPVVEVQPRELAVDVERRVAQIGHLARCGPVGLRRGRPWRPRGTRNRPQS